MLGSFLKSIFSQESSSENLPEDVSQMDEIPAAEQSTRPKSVLNVGGNNKSIPIPEQYAGWNHVLLDIDPKGAPDVVCDARKLTDLPKATYESVYCSHNLEHYYQHDVKKVLAGFSHVLKDDGFVYLRVPDMGSLMQAVARDGLDIEDLLYQSPAGPISVKDVIYGYGVEIERSGNDFYAHKTGFTEKSLRATLERAGFSHIYIQAGALEIAALAFKSRPSDAVAAQFGISPDTPAESGKPS